MEESAMGKGLKVVFDTIPLASDKLTGIGWCEAEQTKALGKNYQEDFYQYNVFSRGNKKDTENVIKRLEDFSEGNIKICKTRMIARVYKILSSFLPLHYDSIFKSKKNQKPDIIHFFNYIVPPVRHSKVIVTVHDMICRAYPDTVRFRTRMNLKLGLVRSMRKATLIVTDSEFSKEEIIKYYPEFEAKIRVVPCGVDTKRFKPCDDKKLIEETKEALQINGDYFLCVGTLEPRKNLKVLIKAYVKFINSIDDKNKAPKLVLTGDKGWLYSDVFDEVRKSGLEDNIIFTSYVPAEMLRPLMCGAYAFLFPSIYEGFGMPPLEAMACGIPVISSNAASMPEVVGEAAIMCNPYDAEEFTKAMLELYNNPMIREKLSYKGMRIARKFSWEKSVEILHKVYEEALEM